MDTVAVPRHAVGPGADAALRRVGGHARRRSRGRRCSSSRCPPERRFAAVAFPSVGAGIGAIRRALQAGHRPVGRAHVRRGGHAAGRSRPVVGEDLERHLHGARLRGRGRGRARWRSGARWRSPRRPAPRCSTRRSGGAGGTAATTSTTRPTSPSCPRSGARSTWSRPTTRLEAVYDALHAAVREPYADTGLELRMHFSHWYLWGAMIYGRFVVPDGGPDALALHERIWEDGMTAALEAGGVMNDHHGVGIKLGPYMRRQHGAALDAMARDQGRAGPERDHEPGQAGPLEERRGGRPLDRAHRDARHEGRGDRVRPRPAARARRRARS